MNSFTYARLYKYMIPSCHHLLLPGVSVSCLSPLPWQEQAQALLEAGQVDRAVLLAEDKGEEGRQVTS